VASPAAPPPDELVPEVTLEAPAPAAQDEPQLAAGPPAVPGSRAGRRHSPGLAVICGLLVPGAGQAYNGQILKAFFLLLVSALVLPYLFSLYDAYATGQRIVQSGGRTGRGGLLWVFFQLWLVVNLTILTLIILTIVGVLR